MVPMLDPHELLTCTLTSEGEFAGATAVMVVPLPIVKEAGLPPKVTAVARAKSVPTMVTEVDPFAAPTLVESELITGTAHEPVV